MFCPNTARTLLKPSNNLNQENKCWTFTNWPLSHSLLKKLQKRKTFDSHIILLLISTPLNYFTEGGTLLKHRPTALPTRCLTIRLRISPHTVSKLKVLPHTPFEFRIVPHPVSKLRMSPHTSFNFRILPHSPSRLRISPRTASRLDAVRVHSCAKNVS